MAAFLPRSALFLRSGIANTTRLPLTSMPCQRYSWTRPFLHSSRQITHRCSDTPKPEHNPSKSVSTLGFWNSSDAWKRAGVNTFRCLVGCTLGDFSAMWFLQANHPDMGAMPIMAISMTSGLATSMLLETVCMRLGRDKLTWVTAAKTAAGMSFVSMLGMETVQNLVDYHLTRGVVALDDPAFWAAAAASAAAGFLAPLPYNYARLKKYGKACH